LPGCPPHHETEENVVPNGRRGVRRGVARRKSKLTALRELVTPDRAILAVDLAPGRPTAVVCDHDSVVSGRRVFTGPAWCIEQIVAEPAAARAGFAGPVLACEQARHRWEPLAVTAGEASL
jgi:transposase